MTNEEILKKAIQKAYDNGVISLDTFADTSGTVMDNFDDDYTYYKAISCIFSHYFARAFWGEEEKQFELEDMNDGTDNFYGFGGKLIYSYAEGGTIKFEGECWKFHLQQMVLEEEPIKYLEKFL